MTTCDACACVSRVMRDHAGSLAEAWLSRKPGCRPAAAVAQAVAWPATNKCI